MKLDYVIVAGGCFWGLEDLLRSLDRCDVNEGGLLWRRF